MLCACMCVVVAMYVCAGLSGVQLFSFCHTSTHILSVLFVAVARLLLSCVWVLSCHDLFSDVCFCLVCALCPYGLECLSCSIATRSLYDAILRNRCVSSCAISWPLRVCNVCYTTNHMPTSCLFLGPICMPHFLIVVAAAAVCRKSHIFAHLKQHHHNASMFLCDDSLSACYIFV